MSIKNRKIGMGNKGFTLVELLIVVAIIGILASQGVPAYKRMIQKSKKGEAQVMLGAISTAEAAFQSEFGTYGNNIARMGAQMDGTGFTYAGGVDVDPGCGQIAAGAIFPAAGTPVATASPSYITQLAGASNMIGRITPYVPANPQSVCQPSAAAATAATYQATATGFIGQGKTPAEMSTCDTGVALCDQWTINQARVLANLNDGVQ